MNMYFLHIYIYIYIYIHTYERLCYNRKRRPQHVLLPHCGMNKPHCHTDRRTHGRREPRAGGRRRPRTELPRRPLLSRWGRPDGRSSSQGIVVVGVGARGVGPLRGVGRGLSVARRRGVRGRALLDTRDHIRDLDRVATPARHRRERRRCVLCISADGRRRRDRRWRSRTASAVAQDHTGGSEVE